MIYFSLSSSPAAVHATSGATIFSSSERLTLRWRTVATALCLFAMSLTAPAWAQTEVTGFGSSHSLGYGGPRRTIGRCSNRRRCSGDCTRLSHRSGCPGPPTGVPLWPAGTFGAAMATRCSVADEDISGSAFFGRLSSRSRGLDAGPFLVPIRFGVGMRFGSACTACS